MRRYGTRELRNVAFVGHGGAGKTSLLDAVLFCAKATNRRGSPEAGSSSFDVEPEELRHRSTIGSKLGHVEWRRCKVNVVDTPGEANFLVDTRLAMGAADAAVVVISAADGVQVATEKVWGFADELALPRAIFLSKLDRERADFERALAEVRAQLAPGALPLQLPIGREEGFEGVIDLVAQQAIRFPDDGLAPVRAELPAGLRAEAARAREQLVDAIAATDDALLERYLEAGALSDEQLAAGLARAVASRALVPVLCGAGGRGLGVQPLLDLIVAALPAPDARPPVVGRAPDGGEVRRGASEEEPFCGWIFRTCGSELGRLSLLRVASGRLAADSSVLNSSREARERIGALYLLQGRRREAAAEVAAGDLVGLAKLRDSRTGDTLCDERHPVVLPRPVLPPPVVAFALRPKTKGDDDRVAAKLAELMLEDAALALAHDPVSKELLLKGMGQLHIEANVEKLRRLGVEVELELPRVPYLETIKGVARHVEGKHKKQTGGKGQYGVCYLTIEPLARGSGFEFVDAVVGGAIPRQLVPAVEKGIRDRMARGVVAGFPVTDVRVTVTDGKHHDVDSDARSFEIAASKGFQAAFRQAHPILLEPIMVLEVTGPEDHLGDLMGDIGHRRGRVLGVEARGRGQVIRAHVPMAETLRYAADLRSLTGGRGSFGLELDHHEELPAHLAERVIAGARLAAEEEE